jgi:starvation-inducible DNA-binding protein
MSDCLGGEHLHPTRLDIPTEVRQYLIGVLNQTLACTIDLRSQVKQVAWNIKGKEFATIRALCISIATELDQHTDTLAERVTVLGGIAMATVRSAATRSTLQEYPIAHMSHDDHVLLLVEHLGHYANAMRRTITLTADVEDAGTTALYTDISLVADKQLVALEAYLQP